MSNEIKTLTRDDILQADDIQREVVSVPEWGGSVIVKSMSGTEREDYESHLIDSDFKPKAGMKTIRATLCAFSIVDENDKLLFSASDIEKLSDKSSASLQRVYEMAKKLSGITESDIDDLEAKKNSETTDGDTSPTA